MKTPTRRGFLTVSGSALAALSLRGLAGCGGDSGSTGTATGTTGGNPDPSSEWELDIKFTTVKLTTITSGPITARLRTYNGKIPGDLITSFPGDVLRVVVRNQLVDEAEKDKADLAAWMALPARLQMLVPHKFNTTNLHVHGVATIPHLFEPVGTSDPTAEMIMIEPGADYHYTLPIPDNHPPGLYWYHPHHHGSTSTQVLNGMAGGLIIKGAIDEVPEIKAARDLVVIVQDLCLYPPLKAGDPWIFSPTQNAIWQTFTSSTAPILDVKLVDGTGAVLQQQSADGMQYDAAGTLLPGAKPIGNAFSTGTCPLRLFLVNGQPVYEETPNPMAPTTPTGNQHQDVPRFTLRPGEVVRFRFLNGCSDNMIPLMVEGHPMHLIAIDGINFPEVRPQAPVPVTTDPMTVVYQVLLGSGNRAEFLIKGSATPGIYGIWQNAQGEQFITSDAKKLAEIEIKGDQMDMALPVKLPAPSRHYPLIPPGAYKQRSIVFGMLGPPPAFNKVVNLDFFMAADPPASLAANNYAALQMMETWVGVDPSKNLGLAYVEERVDVDGIKSDSVEEWTIQDNSMLINPKTMKPAGSMEGHPFHLHETSFEVIEIDGKAVPAAEIRLQDTIWVPHGQAVKIRLRFENNAIGKSVLHCHLLPHEDSGMMLNTLVSA
jgi:FtsP/CotA-like multicopper oxidase with cupredoxin domain